MAYLEELLPEFKKGAKIRCDYWDEGKYKGYEKDNIHLLPWSENRFKQTMERRSRKGKVLQILNGEVVRVWKSQREAWKKLNVEQSMLSMALTGKCKTAYGYEWKYENKELLK